MVNEPIRWNNYITNQQLEISTSSNWKFQVQSGNFEFQTGNFDIPTGNFELETRNFDFGKLEISTSQLKISSSNSKFRLQQTGNFDIPTGNFEFKLLACWKLLSEIPSRMFQISGGYRDTSDNPFLLSYIQGRMAIDRGFTSNDNEEEFP